MYKSDKEETIMKYLDGSLGFSKLTEHNISMFDVAEYKEQHYKPHIDKHAHKPIKKIGDYF